MLRLFEFQVWIFMISIWVQFPMLTCHVSGDLSWSGIVKMKYEFSKKKKKKNERKGIFTFDEDFRGQKNWLTF